MGIILATGRWDDEDASEDENGEPSKGAVKPLEESRRENHQAHAVGSLKTGALATSYALSDEEDDEVYAIEVAKKEAAERERRRCVFSLSKVFALSDTAFSSFFLSFLFCFSITAVVAGLKMGM